MDWFDWAGRGASPHHRLPRATASRAIAIAFGLATCVAPAVAHGGSLGAAVREPGTVSTWGVVGAGLAVVGVSLLVARSAQEWQQPVAWPARYGPWSLPARPVLRTVAGVLGVAVLVGVVGTGFLGPTDPLSSPAIAVVWVGWWAGYAMSTYLVGNTWPALNPWRTLTRWLPTVGRTYQWRWGGWPSVVALLTLVWLAVVSPMADSPRVLAVTVVAYTAVTVAGGLVYGSEGWFRAVDPVSRTFWLFGQVAPLGRDRAAAPGAVTLRLPGSALTEDLPGGREDAAFVVAVLWVTTFDGLVATPLWATFARRAVAVGVAPLALYLVTTGVGFGIFWSGYLLSIRLGVRMGAGDVTAGTLAGRFAPPFLAIAAGYHFAHLVGYLLSLLPMLLQAVTSPVSITAPQVIVVPGWVGAVAVGAVLVGHVLATVILVERGRDLSPDAARIGRTHYPILAVMTTYSLLCLWIVTRPAGVPPFV
jgi:hypothetical protein